MIGGELLYFSDNSGYMWHIIHLPNHLTLYIVY